jgi:dienelactone hydrolase
MYLLITLTALTAVESGTANFHPTAAEAQVPADLRLEASTFPFEIEPIRDDPRFNVAKVRFPSPVVSPVPQNNTVHAEYFRPRGDGRHPGVVVLHILGADFALSRYLSARLADAGVAALFVKLPYYGERRPDGPAAETRFLSANIGRSTEAMRQGILDVRRAVAWLAGRPEIDPARLGVTGISLGGIIASVAAAVDPSIDRVGILLAGGGLADILWNMPEREARIYRQAWLDSGRTFADLEDLVRPYDPLTHAAGLKGKRVLMIAGNVDEVIPPHSARQLWEAAGKPPIRWLDCGHYSAVGYLLPAIRETVAFLAAPADPPVTGRIAPAGR